MSETFCPLPWIAVGMRNNGDLRVCCHSNNSIGKGLVAKTDNTHFNAATDSLEDFRNTGLLKSIRKSMLAGEWHENCVRCKKETEAGVRSRIQYERTLRDSIINLEKAEQMTAPDGAITADEVPLALLDVRFGNQCNLACRTCNPTESSRWYMDHVELYGKTFKYGDKTLEISTPANGRVELTENFFEWYKNKIFIESLPQLLKNVSQIYIAGGEPLKTKAHSEFLEKIIELGFQGQISLEYNTNGYVIPDHIWGLWDQFKEVKIGLSIDSISEMNDYIRYPSKWDLLEKNIKRFDESGPQFIVWLCLTVHCYNIYYLPELIEWRVKSQFKKINNSLENLIFSDHPLHNPKHLNVQILPLDVKEKIIEKFEKFKLTVPELIKQNDFMSQHPQESIKQINGFLDSYKNFMLQSNLTDYFQKFVNYTGNLDRIRKESFAHVFPDFHTLVSAGSPSNIS